MRGLVKSTVPCGIGILIPVVAGSRGVCQWYVVRGTVPGTCTPGSTFYVYVLPGYVLRSTCTFYDSTWMYCVHPWIHRYNVPYTYTYTQHEQTFISFSKSRCTFFFFFFFRDCDCHAFSPTTLQQIKRDQMVISSVVHQLVVLILFQLALNLYSYIAHAGMTQRIQCGGRYFLCFYFICFVIIRGFFGMLHQRFRWHTNH